MKRRSGSNILDHVNERCMLGKMQCLFIFCMFLKKNTCIHNQVTWACFFCPYITYLRFMYLFNYTFPGIQKESELCKAKPHHQTVIISKYHIILPISDFHREVTFRNNTLSFQSQLSIVTALSVFQYHFGPLWIIQTVDVVVVWPLHKHLGAFFIFNPG